MCLPLATELLQEAVLTTTPRSSDPHPQARFFRPCAGKCIVDCVRKIHVRTAVTVWFFEVHVCENEIAEVECATIRVAETEDDAKI